MECRFRKKAAPQIAIHALKHVGSNSSDCSGFIQCKSSFNGEQSSDVSSTGIARERKKANE